MDAEAFTTYAGWIGAGLAGAAACYERFRNRKKDELEEVAKAKDEVAKAKDDLNAALTKEMEAWKAKSERLHDEFHHYRVNAHQQAGEAQAAMLKLNAEVARLQHATDLTPLLKHQEEQTQINAKIMKSLDMIMQHLAQLAQLSDDCPIKRRARVARLKRKAKEATK